MTLPGLGLASSAFGESVRPLAAAELHLIKYARPVRSIYKGMPDSTSLSVDDVYLTSIESTGDIQSHEIVLLNTDSLKIRRVPEPYGHKSDPIVLGGRYGDGLSAHQPSSV